MSLRVSGNNYSNYQSMYQMMRSLQASRTAAASRTNQGQAVAPINRVPRVKSGSTQYADTLKFVQNYGKGMTDIKISASRLQSGNSSGVFSGLDIQSSNPSAVSVDKTFRPRKGTEINVQVQSLAQSQQNQSLALDASGEVADNASMDFEVTSARGRSVRVNVSATTADGAKKTNEQMLQEAADQINSSRTGIQASVAKEDGKVSLVLSSEKTGESNRFAVQGKMGAAEGTQNVAVEGQNAQYTVTQNGSTVSRSSESNKISLDYGRVEATLTGTGSAQVKAGVDSDQVVSAVKDLVSSYNEATDFLKANSSRGQGTKAQYDSFSRDIANERTLKAVGISYDKSGKLQVDEKALKKALSDDFEGTKEILGGQFGLADRITQRVDSAMSVSSGKLVDQDISAGMDRNQESTFSSFRYLSNFSGTGPYSLGNYYTVGLLLNTLG
ncbi:MAG: flagellar filament capping protein FliD [Lachnospiraceae bacterium]|nr:flagellar filament capping protein FliD [Lachnospiraceae bacterium]